MLICPWRSMPQWILPRSPALPGRWKLRAARLLRLCRVLLVYARHRTSRRALLTLSSQSPPYALVAVLMAVGYRNPSHSIASSKRLPESQKPA